MNHGVWEEISKNMLSTPYLKNDDDNFFAGESLVLVRQKIPRRLFSTWHP